MKEYNFKLHKTKSNNGQFSSTHRNQELTDITLKILCVCAFFNKPIAFINLSGGSKRPSNLKKTKSGKTQVEQWDDVILQTSCVFSRWHARSEQSHSRLKEGNIMLLYTAYED